MKRVAIVGAGIAGLSLAHALRKRSGGRGIDVVVLEASARAGGNIRSERQDGYLIEWGPNGFLDSAPMTLALVGELGLVEELHVSSDRARRRFLFRNGRLHEMPAGPAAFVRSRLLSPGGKLRLALEPFAQARPEGDETIHAFAARRIGREAADVLIDSMVSGVFGGDARELSLRSCFPKMWQMETDHGGLFRALFASLRARRLRKGDAVGAPLGRLTSFRGGTEELVRGLVRSLGGIVRTATAVASVEQKANGFTLAIGDGVTITADAVAMCGGARASAALVGPVDEDLAAQLGSIPAAPLCIVCLGYSLEKLPSPPDGFGFLVPRGEGPRILGVLWDSSIYEGRAPAEKVLLRAMIGGACDPDAVRLEERELVDIVRRDLASTMGITIAPEMVRIIRHPDGIPQYTVGHAARLSGIESALRGHPGLFVGGNSYRGVAINACIEDAEALADRVLAAVRPAP